MVSEYSNLSEIVFLILEANEEKELRNFLKHKLYSYKLAALKV